MAATIKDDFAYAFNTIAERATSMITRTMIRFREKDLNDLKGEKQGSITSYEDKFIEIGKQACQASGATDTELNALYLRLKVSTEASLLGQDHKARIAKVFASLAKEKAV